MNREEGLRNISLRTFSWLLAQDGTSDVEQLVVVVCQDPDSEEFSPIDIDLEVVLKACRNLIVEEGRITDLDSIHNSGNFVSFALSRLPVPPSARGYLSNSHSWQGDPACTLDWPSGRDHSSPSLSDSSTFKRSGILIHRALASLCPEFATTRPPSPKTHPFHPQPPPSAENWVQ